MKSHIMPGVALMVILFFREEILWPQQTRPDNVTLNNDKISGRARYA